MTLVKECGCCCPDNVEKIKPCPSCGTMGTTVSKRTVQHLLMDELSEELDEGDYSLCMNPACHTAYFSHDTGVRYQLSQVKVPLWYKQGATPKYVCYCSRVTEEQVIQAVKEEGALTLKEVIKKTGAMTHPDCLRKNPLGICCDKSIQEAIDKALSR